MGFFSAVGSFISGGISAIGSAISSAVGSIGSAVSSFAKNFAPTIGSILAKVHPVLGTVSLWASAIGQVLNLFRPDEKVEDIGDRALQAQEQNIKPEKFENFDAYMDGLRNFDLDPEVSDKTPTATKLVAGMAIATLGMEDKFNLERGSLNGIWLLPMTNADYFTPERMKSLLENGKTIGDIGAYIEKRMSGEDASAFRKNLEITPEGKPMNSSELGQLYSAVEKSRNEWAELKKQIKDSN